MFELVRRHRKYDRVLHERVMMQDQRLVVNHATEESRRLHRMQQEVLRCLHTKKGFLRFNVTGSILYAKTKLEHDVIDLLLWHFHQRFPGYYIALECDGRTHVIDLKGRLSGYKMGVEKTIRRFDVEASESPEERLNSMESDRIWGEYYESQRIEIRQNLKLMAKMMPHKHRDSNALETWKALRSRRLGEYLE